MAMNALKLASVLQRRVAMTLYSLGFPKTFSIRWRHLYVSRSRSVGRRRLDLGGITASTSVFAKESCSQFASNARSASNLAADLDDGPIHHHVFNGSIIC